jgi:hypothetical protein
LNDPRIVVLRRGESTRWEMSMVKEFGHYADEAVLRSKTEQAERVCDYLEEIVEGNPIHQHKDLKYWFYEENWEFESGPFDTYEAAYAKLHVYCVQLEKTKQELAEAALRPPELEIDISVQQATDLLEKLHLDPKDIA